jgi:hypothetical protein
LQIYKVRRFAISLACLRRHWLLVATEIDVMVVYQDNKAVSLPPVTLSLPLDLMFFRAASKHSQLQA